MTPHPHAEIIKAWADGQKIQFRTAADAEWLDVQSHSTPAFNTFQEYRVKPQEDEFHTVQAFAFYEPKNGRLTLDMVSAYPPNLRLTFDHTGRLVGADQYERG